MGRRRCGAATLAQLPDETDRNGKISGFAAGHHHGNLPGVQSRARSNVGRSPGGPKGAQPATGYVLATVRACLRRLILCARHSGLRCTISTAKGLVALLDPVTDDAAAAMCAPRRHGFDCAFETIECHASLTLGDHDRIVIVVSAHIADGHLTYLSDRGRPFILLKSPNRCGVCTRFDFPGIRQPME
jgi:hypothetical protein